jgi:hypothetical protein
MMASEQNKYPDFFEDHNLDPLATATGSRAKRSAPKTKKKAGFYLSEDLLERFNHCFHRMKLEGASVENKSALLEKALSFALDDLDRGPKSKLRATFEQGAQ